MSIWASSSKDVLAHLVDWERIGAEGLRDMAAERSPQVEHVEDIEAWNQVHYEARRDQAWEVVWADLHAAREAFLEALGEMARPAWHGPSTSPAVLRARPTIGCAST